MRWWNQIPRKCLQLSFAATVFFYMFALSGCMVGPDYKKPEPNMPAKWSWLLNAKNQQDNTDEIELVDWWKTFDDPTLTSLVERAVKSNLDLKVAESRIRQARASQGIVTGGLWPSITAGASATRGMAARATSQSFFQDNLDAVWELDVFGGIRRGIESAKSDVIVAIESRRDILITLAGEVALNYIELRGFQQQILIAQENLEIQKHNAEVTHKRFQAGFVAQLDVANADAQVATTASTIPPQEASARQTIYNLSVLLGQEPAALLEELSPKAKIPLASPTVPVGVPSDLLRRRPDIRQAEAQIHSATARIGVATADLFPKVSLSGNVGMSGNKFGSLTSGNGFWSVGPSVNWSLFAGGSIVSNIELQKALTQESFLTYQKTVLTAMQEVENALVASTSEQERLVSLEEAVTANRKAVQLATQLYSEGQIEFLNLLDAQRSLYVTESALVQSNQNVSTNLVALYKALGGGWNEEPATVQK